MTDTNICPVCDRAFDGPAGMMIHFGKEHPETPKPWQSDSDNWPATREYVLKRDNFECGDCGVSIAPSRERSAEVHHKTPVSEGGSDDLSNLVALCRDCHLKRHRQDDVRESTQPMTNKDTVETTVGSKVVETPKRIYNPVRKKRQDLTKLSEDGYCRRFLALKYALENRDPFENSPVFTFDTDRWEIEERNGTYVVTKKEAESEFDEMVLKYVDA